MADAAGTTVEAVTSRLHRLRRKFGCNRLQLVTLIDRVIRGAGEPGFAFFHPGRAVRGTNGEAER